LQSSKLDDALLPVLKWAGGKRSLVEHILPHFSVSNGRYFEPFLGGAALFLASGIRHARLSDLNEELINFYVQVRDRPLALVKCMRVLNNDEETYYAEREKGLKGVGLRKAARFVFLTTLSFNGIYRQNLQGVFNVPYGGRNRSQWFVDETIFAISERLQQTELLTCDFESAVDSAKTGDLIYLDPPYTVAHSNNGFVKYNSKIFSWDDQIRLSAVAKSLVKRGCRVIVSNADHDSIRCLYQGFREYKIVRASVIAASADNRRRITESLFVS